ncbi:MAG: 3-isopropylmalate dehydratase small subunit [Acidobacteriota bacterium]
MNKFTQHSGTLTPLYRANIDTDQIIPKQFLKRIERTGYRAFLFYDWRYNSDGSLTDGFVMNDQRFNGSSILIAGPNFGCGSSREHAPWSLMDFGFRVVIAPSFADIFHNNSLKNGLLPVVLPEADVADLAKRAELDPAFELKVDLISQTVSGEMGFLRTFEIDAFRKHSLLNGLDDIGLTLQHESRITEYEENHLGEPRFSYLSN